MNSDFPPLQFLQPSVKRRRRERIGFPDPPNIPSKVRREIALRLHKQQREITRQLRLRTPDERRAIFFRLKHDRPLTRKDLSGTGLAFLAAPSETESLVVPKKDGLKKLEKRIGEFGKGKEDGRPKGSEFATNVREIDIADPKDRLSADFLSTYEELISASYLVYEIEIGSLASLQKSRKKEVEEIFRSIHAELGRGIRGSVFEADFLNDGARIVLWSTGAMLKNFVEDPKWWRKVTFFDLRPRFETFSQTFSNFNVGKIRIEPPPTGSDTICVIDTGVALGNPFLKPVLNADESRSFAEGFSATQDAAGHGSGVASLAAFHSLEIADGGFNRAEAFVVSARITTDEGQLDIPPVENADIDRQRQARLLSNILREIVVHYRPKGITIFVLAFQIVGHVWSKASYRLVPRNSWVARTIDQLSREFDVVFVNITGNLALPDIEELHSEEPYPAYLLRPPVKLLDPGQASLSVTVGSIAHSALVIVASQTPIALVSQPSPFTRSGPGFGGSQKPDFVERGGNLALDGDSGRVSSNPGMNVLMASGRLTPALQHNNGTSFAAPRIAYHLAVIKRDLRTVGIEASAPLLRTFLATSAVRPTKLASKEETSLVLGHGLPDGTRATDCSKSAVVLFWQGALLTDSSALFRIPVPVDLRNSGRGKKRLTVAIAIAPPVQSWGVAEYLGSEMKFWVFRGDEDPAKIEALIQRSEGEENVSAKEGVDHLPGEFGISSRTSGTLQLDHFDWNDHKEEYSASDYIVAITLKSARWCDDNISVPAAITVRLEDLSGRCDTLYSQVRTRVTARVRS